MSLAFCRARDARQKASGALFVKSAALAALCLCLAAPLWASLSYKNYEIRRYGGSDILCDTYVVREGDHVANLFRLRGQIVEHDYPEFLLIFQALNPGVTDVDKIFPGQKILIPLKKVPPGSLPRQESGSVTLPVMSITDQAWQEAQRPAGQGEGGKSARRAIPCRATPGDTIASILQPRYGKLGTKTYQRALEQFRALNPSLGNINRISVGQDLLLPHPEDVMAGDAGPASGDAPEEAAPKGGATASKPSETAGPARTVPSPEARPVKTAAPAPAAHVEKEPSGTQEEGEGTDGETAEPRPPAASPAAPDGEPSAGPVAMDAETGFVDVYIEPSRKGGLRHKEKQAKKYNTYKPRMTGAGKPSMAAETAVPAPALAPVPAPVPAAASVPGAGPETAVPGEGPAEAASETRAGDESPGAGPGAAPDAKAGGQGPAAPRKQRGKAAGTGTGEGTGRSLSSARPQKGDEPGQTPRAAANRPLSRSGPPEFIASGVYYFPRPGQEDFRLDLSEYPIIKLPSGERLFVSPVAPLNLAEKTLVQNFWGPVHALEVPHGETSRGALASLLQSMGAGGIQKELSFDNQGVKATLRTSLILPGLRSKSFVALSWIRNAEEAADSRLKEYLKANGISLLEILPSGRLAKDLGNGDGGSSPGPDQLVLDARSCRVYIALLMQLFQLNYAENVPVSLPDRGKQVESFTNIVRLDSGKEFILDFPGEENPGSPLLPQLGIPVAPVHPEKGCLQVAADIFEKMGFEMETNPVFKAGAGNGPTGLSLVVSGVMIKRDPLPETLVTETVLDNNVVEFLKARGIRVMMLRNRYCS
jgi:hypothetical protein